MAKGLVRREVVRVYTPGTLFDENLLDAKESNFLASIAEVPTPNEGIVRYGMAAVDLSTGEYVLAEFCGAHAQNDLLDELIRIGPQELILPSNTTHVSQKLLGAITTLKIPFVRAEDQNRSNFDEAQDILLKQFQVTSIQELGLDSSMASMRAGAMVLDLSLIHI